MGDEEQVRQMREWVGMVREITRYLGPVEGQLERGNIRGARMNLAGVATVTLETLRSMIDAHAGEAVDDESA